MKIKALTSRNSISEYTKKLTWQDKAMYFDLLVKLHNGEDFFNDTALDYSGLKSADIVRIKDDTLTLRIFKYKKGNEKGYTVSPEVKRIIYLWSLHNPAAQYWYANKTFIDSIESLLSAYGMKRISDIVVGIIPFANRYEYVPKIKNPQDLLRQIGAGYMDTVKTKNVVEENKEKINQLLETYNTEL